MRPGRSPLRGSVTQNVARVRVRENDGISFLARLGLLAVLVLTFIVAVTIGWNTGWFDRQGEHLKNHTLNLTKQAEFEVKDIVVEGRRQSSKQDIFDALGVKQGMPLLSVDTDDAAKRLGKLPWIETVRVERRMPDTVSVILTERMPLARWQHNEKIGVIDTEGRVLPSAKAETFAALPLVVGEGAEHDARALLDVLKAYPDIGALMESAVRVSERRWDLHLARKITVRLPETKIENALHRLSVQMSEEKILDRNIVAIDLRVPDRLIVEPAVAATPQPAKKK